MRSRRLFAVVIATSLATAGCAATRSDTATPARSTPGTQRTSAAGTTGDLAGPSAPAQMICSNEIRAAIKSAFALPTSPRSTQTWSNRIFRCTYDVAGAPLALSVKDSPDQRSGGAYFDALRSQLSKGQPVQEFDSLGFPAFQTPDGKLALIKDGKTLLIDATGLPAASLPDGFARTDVAYTVAIAVVTCWTE
jgi:hypothetical protein